MFNNLFDIRGKIALVTGGSRGIGEMIAAGFLANGAKVYISSRKADACAATAERLQAAYGGECIAIPANLADVEGCQQLADTLSAREARLDILINNAGNAISVPFEKIKAEQWNEMISLNLTGVFHCTQACLPAMKKQKWGRVINIASTAGLKAYAYVSAYCAAKHGVIGLTRSLALETANAGITVNAICPGYTETAITESAIENISLKTGRTKAEAREELLKNNPQKRFIQPEEIANTVLWLCQQEAASVTGQAISISGGEVMS